MLMKRTHNTGLTELDEVKSGNYRIIGMPWLLANPSTFFAEEEAKREAIKRRRVNTPPDQLLGTFPCDYLGDQGKPERAFYFTYVHSEKIVHFLPSYYVSFLSPTKIELKLSANSQSKNTQIMDKITDKAKGVEGISLKQKIEEERLFKEIAVTTNLETFKEKILPLLKEEFKDCYCDYKKRDINLYQLFLEKFSLSLKHCQDNYVPPKLITKTIFDEIDKTKLKNIICNPVAEDYSFVMKVNDQSLPKISVKYEDNNELWFLLSSKLPKISDYKTFLSEISEKVSRITNFKAKETEKNSLYFLQIEEIAK